MKSKNVVGNTKKYPPYYELVNIVFKNKCNENVETIAWLSWSEKYGYIWTISGTDIVVLDKDVIKIM